MLRSALALSVLLASAPGCKTGNSKAQTFTVEGDAAAANALIVETVIKALPETASSRPEIVKFATALQNDTAAGGLSPETLLKQYYAKRADQSGGETDFDRYVVQEFIVLTNYLTVKRTPGTELKYIPPTAKAKA